VSSKLQLYSNTAILRIDIDPVVYIEHEEVALVAIMMYFMLSAGVILK